MTRSTDPSLVRQLGLQRFAQVREAEKDHSGLRAAQYSEEREGLKVHGSEIPASEDIPTRPSERNFSEGGGSVLLQKPRIRG
jgi:hypothetical protein